MTSRQTSKGAGFTPHLSRTIFRFRFGMEEPDPIWGGRIQAKIPLAEHNRCASKGAGFTLMELLITLALVVLVAATIISVLAGGFRVWERAQEQEAVDQEVWLVLEGMRKDLHNAQRFGAIPFEGSYDTLSFPTLVERYLMKDGTMVKELGRLGYFHDGGKKLLCRSIQPYRVIRSKSLRDSCQPVASGIERIRFSYYKQDPVTGGYEWTSSFSAPDPPVAVKIEVGYRGESKEMKSRVLVVHLPIAPIPKKGKTST